MNGSANERVFMMTERIMLIAKANIAERKEPILTTGQYNSIYEAIQKILEDDTHD